MTGPVGYEDLRVETVVSVAKMAAAAAITAPKSGGMLFLAGKPNFIETVIVDDKAMRRLRATRPAPSSSTRPRPAAGRLPRALNGIDCRCQTRIVTAARKLGVIKADLGVSLSLSMTAKSVGYDRVIPTVDFDTLDLPATHTLPVGEKGAGRYDGARNRQQLRHPLR